MSHEHSIHIFINKQKYELEHAVQTGSALKQLAGIPLSDVLFLQRPGDDEVIGNDAKVTLKNGDHLHSQPPADYGLGPAQLAEADLGAERAAVHAESGGWSFLVISGYKLPAGFQPNSVDLLVKLPPGFPDAAPDMFWIFPPCVPRAASRARRPASACWARTGNAFRGTSLPRLEARRELAARFPALRERPSSSDGLRRAP